MAEPTEDEVRAWLAEQETFLYGLSLSRTLTTEEHRRHTLLKTNLAMLDEARKDKERLDWQDAQRWIEIGAGAEDMQVECEAGVFRGRSLRAAIDQARREENT